ncbi:hypothetical protein PoMZ_11544 [Pyricularia oryzae]|uniref:Uncharacterized protein n=1 Tax=Pyricularia oryzae TaxID=318829 RepID=A0A4P7NKL7_PYROR|nr:hypothetical protein PoMZ_11544 [Pyricularia oryzae]
MPNLQRPGSLSETKGGRESRRDQTVLGKWALLLHVGVCGEMDQKWADVPWPREVEEEVGQHPKGDMTPTEREGEKGNWQPAQVPKGKKRGKAKKDKCTERFTSDFRSQSGS